MKSYIYYIIRIHSWIPCSITEECISSGRVVMALDPNHMTFEAEDITCKKIYIWQLTQRED